MRRVIAALALVGALAACSPSARSVDWSSYGSGFKAEIDRLAVAADCAGLQDVFDYADSAGDPDLMAYVDSEMREAGCYR